MTTTIAHRRTSHNAARIRGSVRLAALGTMILALASAMILAPMIAGSASRHQLAYTTSAEEGMKPDEAMGVALGAFRGMFVNILWMRANDMKEQGKFHEAVDLARTITRLQPRFPAVWQFHAWNLAYNISVVTTNVAERWHWVNAGIRLLRDEGIPQNPNSILLHKELSWLLMHKVQGYMDDANQYYKRQFAIEWTTVLGAPPERTIEMRTIDGATKAYEQWLRNTTDAPRTLAGLYEAEPEARRVLDLITAQTKVDLSTAEGRKRFLFGYEVVRAAFKRDEAMRKLSGKGLAGLTSESKLASILTDPANLKGRRALVNFIRRRVLVEDYHMEPDRMIRYTQKYGPLDWRHASAHAIYWAQRGVEQSLDVLNHGNDKDIDFLNVDRQVAQSLQEMYRSGTVIFDILDPETYFAVPNDLFIPAYGRLMEELTERENRQFEAMHDADIRGRAYRFYAAGYENFLIDAISFLYRRGQLDEAKKWQRVLVESPGLNRNDKIKELMRQWDLDTLVQENIRERITSPNIAVAEVNASVMGALIYGLLAGDTDVYVSQMTYAKNFHKAFMDEQYRLTAVDPEKARMEMMPKDFNETAGIFTAYTLGIVGPTNALSLWARLGDDVKLYAYDEFLRRFIGGFAGLSPEEQQRAEAEFAQIFPPPPGLKEHRAMMAQRRGSGVDRGKVEMK